MQLASDSSESDNAKTGNSLSLTDLAHALPCLEGKGSFAVLVPVATFIDHDRKKQRKTAEKLIMILSQYDT